MDAVYHAVKDLMKSILNLFVAIIGLFTALINGIASVLGKLRIRKVIEYFEMKSVRNRQSKEPGDVQLTDKGEDMVEKIRGWLQGQVVSKDTYYCFYAHSSDSGIGFYMMILAILFSALAGTVVLCIGGMNDYEIPALVLIIIFCVAACIAIFYHQKKVFKNMLIRQILKEEFKDKIWEGPVSEEQVTSPLSENADNPC